MSKILNRALSLGGETIVIAGISITAKMFNTKSHVTEAEGATVPVNGTVGYAKGCRFVKTSTSVSTIGQTVFINEGDGTSCDFNLQANSMAVQSKEITVPTTSAISVFIIAPSTGSLSSLIFSGHDVLATSDSNYIVWTATNLGQAGAGSTAMLATSPAGINTTKATGGTALAADTYQSLTLSGTAANIAVTKGDRIQVTATVTGTLANTVTLASYLANFN